VEIWWKLHRWTRSHQLPIRPPIHYGAYLDSFCHFVDEIVSIGPLWRRLDIFTCSAHSILTPIFESQYLENLRSDPRHFFTNYTRWLLYLHFHHRVDQSLTGGLENAIFYEVRHIWHPRTKSVGVRIPGTPNTFEGLLVWQANTERYPCVRKFGRTVDHSGTYVWQSVTPQNFRTPVSQKLLYRFSPKFHRREYPRVLSIEMVNSISEDCKKLHKCSTDCIWKSLQPSRSFKVTTVAAIL